MHKFPSNITIEHVSDDPSNADFLAFKILTTKGKNHKMCELGRFRASNIVQLRQFMASLGRRGIGLFCKNTGSGQVEATLGAWDQVEEVDDADEESVTVVVAATNAQMQKTNLTYMDIMMKQLPAEYYHSSLTDIVEKTKQGFHLNTVLPLHEESLVHSKPQRRKFHDTFRPPIGQPVNHHVSLGYGSEIGLPSSFREIQIPSSGISFFIDHDKQALVLADPRAALKPKPTIKLDKVVYGDRRVNPVIPQNICNTPSIIESTSKRAGSKPVGFILDASGKRGSDSPRGSDGAPGYNGKNGSDSMAGFLGFGASRYGR